MAVERYGNKTDVVVKLILVFFISLLSFSIGTFVGKKFSDNQHKISQLESGAGDKEDGASHEDRAVASVTGQDEKTKDALSSEEIAKLAEEFVADDEKPAAGEKEHGTATTAAHEAPAHGEAIERKVSSEDAHAAPAKHEEPKIELKKDTAKHEAKADEHGDKKADKVGHAADNIAEGKAAHDGETHAEKKAGPPSALPKNVAASAAGKFTVQVAAYPKEDEAQNMAGDLKNKGFSAFYVPAQVKGQTWYRVSVGLFTTEKEAKAYREDLLSRGKVGSAMVQKITQ